MNRLTIRSRLLLGFFFITVLPLGGLGLFYINTFERSLTETVLQNLSSIADKNSDQINSFIDERIIDVQTYSRSEYVAKALDEFSHAFARGGVTAIEEIEPLYRSELVTLQESGLYYDLLLIDIEGNVVFSVIHESDYGTNLNTGAYRESGLAKSYRFAVKTLNTANITFEPYAPSFGKVASFMVSPVLSGKKLLGAIALQTNLSAFNQVLADRTGLGLTGETVLATPERDGVLVTSPLKHVDNAAFNFYIARDKTTSLLPIMSAVQGRHAESIEFDYVGHEVAVATRFLPAMGWGMVVKIDTAEALSQRDEVAQLVWLSLGLLLITSAGAALLFSHSFTRPIDNLIDATTRVSDQGILADVDVVGSPELRQLAQSFNHMVGRVTMAQSGLEQKIVERTRELQSVSAFQSAILDNAAYAIIATTNDGVITHFNRAAERMLGYSAEEMVGNLTPAVFHLPEEVVARATEFGDELGIALEPSFEVFVTRARRGLPNEYEWTYVRKDSTQFPVLLSVTVLSDSAGDINGFLGVAIDITERKQVELSLLESTHQLNDAQRLAKVGSWSLDLRSNYLEWSDEIFRLFEIDKSQFSASYEAFLEAIHPEDREMVNQAYSVSLTDRQPYEITHRLALAGGRIKYVHEMCETDFDVNGNPLISRGTVQDITEQKIAEETINLYANVFRFSAEAIMITDHENRIVAVNPALIELTGYSTEELLGENPSILASGQTVPETYQKMWQALQDKGHWQGEMYDRHKSGVIYPKWISISVIKNSAGTISHHIATFVDITERKAAEDRIHHLAHHDALTGLTNRHSLEQQLAQIIATAQRSEQLIALMFIDLDRFKVINDTLGHQIGDALLIEVARRLKDAVRDSDIVARIGGDEFVVIYTGVESNITAAPIAAFLTHILAQPYIIDGNELHTSPSIGISIYPDDGEDSVTLMKNADTAMYHAKKNGRNNFQFFTGEMNLAAHERMYLEQELRKALDKSELELYYQPQLDANDGRVIGAEALVRWNHPVRGFIPPDKFIPIAEDSRLIIPLGNWVLEEACRQLALWRDMGITPLKMAVNLSAKQLRDPKLIDSLKKLINTYNITEGELELEVTETAAMANADEAIALMKCIRAQGIELAIDDFGTGYSSLAYLKLFPIQTLKLDQTFVRDIEVDENDAAISVATISLAHNLGFKVVAEGVETEAQRTFLTSHRCDILQGYLFSRPLPADQFMAYMKDK